MANKLIPIALVLAVVFCSWFAYYFSDKEVIKRQLTGFAGELEKETGETAIQLALKMRAVKDQLADMCRIVVPERSFDEAVEQDLIIRYLMYRHNSYEVITVVFEELQVDMPAKDEAAAQVAAAARVDGCIELRIAASQQEVDQLWKTRKALSPALRNIAPKKINEDVVVPISQLPRLIEGLEQLSLQHRIKIVNFGHAGNGNIHVNLLTNPDDPGETARAEACLSDVFSLVLELQGTLSGEHGVGIVKRDYIARELDPVALQLMHQIKHQFDPNNILNPGKTLPAIKDSS